MLDDEPAVGTTIGTVAVRAGFETRVTTTAEEFFRLQQEWRPTHVVLDLIMPDVDGIEVLHELARRRCAAAIIIMSGASGRVLDAAHRAATERGLTVAGVMQKPFSISRLRTLLSEGAYTPDHIGLAPPAPPDAVGEDELWTALEKRQLDIFLQPKISCATGELKGFEALVRWLHPERGLVLPDAFVPLAEETGLIEPLTDQVLAMGLDWLAEFDRPELNLSLNLSARSFDDIGLADRIEAACRKKGIEPGRIVLEVTETSAMNNPVTMLDLSTRLRLKSFQLSIDDFGVGYASLVHLARLPFSEMKVDAKFVVNLARSEEAQKIVKAIIGLGRSLGLCVVAEGVEEREALDILRHYDCDMAQGYFVARPMPTTAVAAWMARSAVRPA